jgi:hypothetical protein
VIAPCDPTDRGSGRRRSDLGDIPNAAVGGLGFRKGDSARSSIAPNGNILLGGGVLTCLPKCCSFECRGVVTSGMDPLYRGTEVDISVGLMYPVTCGLDERTSS